MAFDILEVHQLYKLKRARNNRALVSGVLVNWRINPVRPYHQKKYGLPQRINRSFFFDVSFWEMLQMKYGKSVPVEEVVDILRSSNSKNIIEIEWEPTEKIWRVEKLLGTPNIT
jgi:hypothetical protein